MTVLSSASPTRDRHSSSSPWGALRVRILGISPAAARFKRRGFAPGALVTQQRLEEVGATFVLGYRAGLESESGSLAAALPRVAAEDRGFAFEGAAMALAMLDLLTPWRRNRLAGWLAGPGEPHAYMVHVGAGWALARLGRRPEHLPALDPLLRWLALDGYGFHEGYFAWRRTIVARRRPAWMRGYEGRVFDQGVGRSLWFFEAGDAGRLARRIASFGDERRSDLWSGVGLAAAYAGGVPDSTLESLRELSGRHLPHVAQGAAFAAKARERAGNPAAHTDRACRVLAGCPAVVAAGIADEALAGLPASSRDDYEGWRHGIRERIASRAQRVA